MTRRGKPSQMPLEERVYQAPALMVGLFYMFMVAWSGAAIMALTQGGDTLWLVMIGFLLAYTWYFALGLSYRVEIDAGGTIQLTSYRRVLSLGFDDIRAIEGPFLPIGFLRFKLEREKAYLFCVATDQTLLAVVKNIVNMNPEIKVKTR
jgi:hypothetical protein